MYIISFIPILFVHYVFSECAPGRFGLQCSKECHCDSSQDICDKDTGFCQSGCAAGWTDLDCQTGKLLHSSYLEIGTFILE